MQKEKLKTFFRLIIPCLLVSGFLILTHFTMGLRTEHFVIGAVILILSWAHPKTRSLMLILLPFALFGGLYDYLRIIPQDWAGSIQVFDPYFVEFLLFAFPVKSLWTLPTDWFRHHYHLVFDLIFAISYTLHIIVPLSLAIYLWLKNYPGRYRYVWAFFIINVFAFITYVGSPVAPPWYVELYGMRPGDFSVPGSAAGLLRLDQWVGISYFGGIYSKGAWVFGAIPSMHAGFPCLCLLYALRFHLKKISWGVLIFTIFVWGAAVYFRHHYIIDLLLGALYALLTFSLVEGFYALWPKKRSSLRS